MHCWEAALHPQVCGSTQSWQHTNLQHSVKLRLKQAQPWLLHKGHQNQAEHWVQSDQRAQALAGQGQVLGCDRLEA